MQSDIGVIASQTKNVRVDFPSRDALVAFRGGRPCAIQAFEVVEDGRMALDRSIFIDGEDRGLGISKIVRDMAVAYLRGIGVERFRINLGTSGESQGLAGSDVRDYGGAVSQKKYSSGGALDRYDIVLSNVRLRYPESNPDRIR